MICVSPRSRLLSSLATTRLQLRSPLSKHNMSSFASHATNSAEPPVAGSGITGVSTPLARWATPRSKAFTTFKSADHQYTITSLRQPGSRSTCTNARCPGANPQAHPLHLVRQEDNTASHLCLSGKRTAEGRRLWMTCDQSLDSAVVDPQVEHWIKTHRDDISHVVVRTEPDPAKDSAETEVKVRKMSRKDHEKMCSGCSQALRPTGHPKDWKVKWAEIYLEYPEGDASSYRHVTEKTRDYKPYYSACGGGICPSNDSLTQAKVLLDQGNS